MLAVDPFGQALAVELLGERPGVLVARPGVGGVHDRAEVAEVDRVELGDGGLGAVAPLGAASEGQ